MSDIDPRIVRRQARLTIICDLLADEALPTTVLLDRLNKRLARTRQSAVSRRTLEQDLVWMRRRMGGCIETVSARQLESSPHAALADARAFHRLRDGERPHAIPDDVGFITGMESLALLAARSALAISGPPGQAGPLADALDSLMRRFRLPTTSGIVDVRSGNPQVPYASATLLACLRSIQAGKSLLGSYRPRHRTGHPIHVQPIRVVIVDGEACLWAWDSEDRICKRYHIAHLVIDQLKSRLAGAPTDRAGDVAVVLRQAFRGVARGPLRTVTVRIVAARVPILGHVHFGQDQQTVDHPDGSRSVSWRTRGMRALVEWLAGAGPEIIAESPPDMVAAVVERSTALLAGYRAAHKRRRSCAQHR